MKKIDHPWWHWFYCRFEKETRRIWSNYDGHLVEEKTKHRTHCSKCKKLYEFEIDDMNPQGLEVVKL